MEQIEQWIIKLVAVILVVGAIGLSIMEGVIAPMNISGAIRLLESKGYWVSAEGGCLKHSLIPCEDGAYDIGREDLGWRDVYVNGGSIYLGDVELSNTGSILSIDGELRLEGDGRVYREVIPDLDFSTVKALGKPSLVISGVVRGFSLPVYKEGEEIYVDLCVPVWWDGGSDFIVHVFCYIEVANPSRQFALEVGWAVYEPTGIVPSGYVQSIVEKETGDGAWRQSYELRMALPGNEVSVGDHMNLRIRRVETGTDDIEGDIVVTHIGVFFRRDRLGDDLD